MIPESVRCLFGTSLVKPFSQRGLLLNPSGGIISGQIAILFDNSADKFCSDRWVYGSSHSLSRSFFQHGHIGFLALAIGNLAVGSAESLYLPCGMTTESQNQSLPITDKLGGKAHEIRQDGFDPAPLSGAAGLFLIRQPNTNRNRAA